MKLAVLTLLCLLVASFAAPLPSSVRKRISLARYCRIIKQRKLRSKWCGATRRPAATSRRRRSTTKRRSAAPRRRTLTTRKGTSKASACLAEHNRERRLVGVPPLKWSRALEASAQKYANMIRGGTFQHSRPGLFLETGENLYRTSKPLARTTWKDMHRLWIQEKQWFRNRVFPNVSTTGNWAKVGHYTAMVWRKTTEVGCAASQGSKGTTFVCHYKQQGNVMGQLTY